MKNGFTLIELIVTLAISVILIGVGVPGFQNVVKTNRLSTQSNTLLAALGYARSEAVKRSVPVAICKRNTAGDACDNSAEWEDGWIMYVDSDEGADFDAGETILQVQDEIPANTLRSDTNQIVYNSKGFAGALNGTFILCFDDDNDGSGDFDATNGRAIEVASTGRARVAKPGIDTLTISSCDP